MTYQTLFSLIQVNHVFTRMKFNFKTSNSELRKDNRISRTLKLNNPPKLRRQYLSTYIMEKITAQQINQRSYLFVNVINPEPSLSSVIWVRGHDWSLVLPDLIYVLHNNCRFTYGFAIMDENWDLLVNWVHLKKQRALVSEILFLVLILNTLFS